MNPFEWAVAAVAVVDQEQRPLYTECFFSREEVANLPAPLVQVNLLVSRDDELHLHFMLHAALDLCADRANGKYLSQGGGGVAAVTTADGSSIGPSTRTSGAGDVRFLDRLLDEGWFSVHGFQSASGIRVLLATVGDAPRDAVLPLCRSVYEQASIALCCPFRVPGEPLDHSRQFVNGVMNIVGPFSATARSAKSA